MSAVLQVLLTASVKGANALPSPVPKRRELLAIGASAAEASDAGNRELKPDTMLNLVRGVDVVTVGVADRCEDRARILRRLVWTTPLTVAVPHRYQ
jgi:hypothetical protein